MTPPLHRRATVEHLSSARRNPRGVQLGIAIDGEGHLGQPGAIASVACAADRLGYRTVWCIGPWATTLAGAVAAITSAVEIGVECPPTVGSDASFLATLDRLVVAELTRWPLGVPTTNRTVTTGPVRFDVVVDRLPVAARDLEAAARLGVSHAVVRLVGDPDIDEALAAYAVLGELVQSWTSDR